MHGWCGRILMVDQSSGKITAEALDPGVARDYIGSGDSGSVTSAGKSTRPATPSGRTTRSSCPPGR
jgi:hypothetical protein